MTHHSREFEIEYDGGTPPLPELLLRESEIEGGSASYRIGIEQLLPAGCYLLRFMPLISEASKEGQQGLRSVLGVLRVEHGSHLPLDAVDRVGQLERRWTRGSGDLYAAAEIVSPDRAKEVWRERGVEEAARFVELAKTVRSRPDQMIVLPRDAHRFYYRVSGVRTFDKKTGEDSEPRLYVELEPYRYEERAARWTPVMPISVTLGEKEEQQQWDARMYTGLRVRNRRLSIVGYLDLARVTGSSPPILRSLAVRIIDKTGEAVSQGQLKEEVKTMFRRSGVAVEFVGGGDAAPEVAPRPAWNQRHLEYELAQDRVSLEKKADDWKESWEYLVYLVPGLEDVHNVYGEMHGVMFDDRAVAGETRRGCAVAVGPEDGGVAQLVAHELGHCLGLYHDPLRPGLMVSDPTANLEETGKPPDRFSCLDSARLKHLPDRWVRPDCLAYSHRYARSPIDLLDLAPSADQLKLIIGDVDLIRNEAIRADFLLTNTSSGLEAEEISVPHPNTVKRRERQHLLSGKLSDPCGRVEALGNLEPAWYVAGSLATLRPGHSWVYSVEFELGGLSFGSIGWYTLEIGLAWVDNLAKFIEPENLSLQRVVGTREFRVY